MNRRTLVLMTIATVGLALAMPAWADTDERSGHLEVPRDPHRPTPEQTGQPRRATHTSRDGHVSVQVNVDEFGNNIASDAANEPSIAVDPTDPTRMAIGWRQFDNISSDFRQAGWAYTADGGNSWTFPGVIEPGVFRSDPVLDADADGNFYYNSLTADIIGGPSNFRCHTYKSSDGGVTWDTGTYALGGDKQWQAIDMTDGIGRGNIYATWNSSFSACSGNFTRSYDGNLSYEPCTTVLGNPYWGTLVVGPDGELYVSGTGMTIAKSTTLQDSSLSAAWDFSGGVDLDGSINFSAGPNPGGLLGQNWVAVDHSDGPTRGNVYMLASVDRSSTADPMDVMFARSTDGGVTWSPPVRVNDDPGTTAWQWFGTMSVAPNGRIDAIWLDTRNDPGGYDSELYYSFSTDAGVTWSPNEALSPAFDPHLGWPQQNKMGDYFDMVSDEFGANLAYAATFNGEQDVYFIRIGDPTCPDDGRVSLDRSTYACSDTVNISVIDCGLDTDSEVVEQIVVDVDSDSEVGFETVTLTETHPGSALFRGSIDISEFDSAGVLLVTEGDTLSVTYVDADDGAGGTDIEVTAQATTECTPPVITNVQSSAVTGQRATITWDTNEPADSTVNYGLTTPDQQAFGADLVTDHLLALNLLQECSTYVYSVSSSDAVSNSATDDNGGAYFSFETGKNSEPEFPSSDTPITIADSATHLSVISVLDDVTVQQVKVGLDISHTYDGDLDITLITPGGTRILLAADQGGSGENFTGTIFDDEAATPISSGSAPFTGSFQPEAPLSVAIGSSSLGDWTLEVIDDAGGDTGTLNSWTLILTYPAQACGPNAALNQQTLEDDECPTGGGDDNGFWEAGEFVQFSLILENNGTDPLTGVSATVTPAIAGMLMLDNVASFPDLAEGGSGASAAPHYTVKLPVGLSCAEELLFDVQINANEGHWSGAFGQIVGEVVPGGGVAFSEDFEAAGIPGDWTIEDGLTDGYTWFADDVSDPSGCANTDPAAPVSGSWVAADSDCAGSGIVMDESLITPVFDLSAAVTAAAEFDHYFHFYSSGGAEKADVDVKSTLTGGVWTNVAQWSTADTANAEHAVVDITAEAAGANDVQLRFHYYDAAFDWYWYVDNVEVTYTSAGACNMLTCAGAPGAPPGVPDGSDGAPVLVDKLAADGSQLQVAWDNICAPVGTNLLFGPLASVSSLSITGSECGVSNPAIWDPAPAGDVWFLLVSDDGAGVEGSWGIGANVERNGLVDSGTCGNTSKDITGVCP